MYMIRRVLYTCNWKYSKLSKFPNYNAWNFYSLNNTLWLYKYRKFRKRIKKKISVVIFSRPAKLQHFLQWNRLLILIPRFDWTLLNIIQFSRTGTRRSREKFLEEIKLLILIYSSQFRLHTLQYEWFNKFSITCSCNKGSLFKSINNTLFQAYSFIFVSFSFFGLFDFLFIPKHWHVPSGLIFPEFSQIFDLSFMFPFMPKIWNHFHLFGCTLIWKWDEICSKTFQIGGRILVHIKSGIICIWRSLLCI